MQRPWRKWFRRERRKAKRLIDDPVAVVRAVDRASRKAERIEGAQGPLARVWNDLHTSVRLVRAWGRRDYLGVGRGTIVLLVGALLYFVSPVDAILDAIPVLGFVDDAAVLTWVVGQVRSELEAFRAWETTRVDGARLRRAESSREGTGTLSGFPPERLEPGESASSEVVASGLVVSPKG